MKTLFIGDIVGKAGRKAVKEKLPMLLQSYNIDLTIANGENAAGGSGLTPKIVEEIFSAGVDVITSGDHIWRKKEIFDVIDKFSCLLRPANFKDFLPGRGFCIKENKNKKLAVINALGRVFMNTPSLCPFIKVRDIINSISKEVRCIIVDFHAEATSEKVAMGYFLAGKVSCVVGTHTHIPTADERIINNYTGYITDVGKKEKVIEHYITDLPQRFEVSSSDLRLQAVFIEIDEDTGRCVNIERVEKVLG